MAKTGKRDGVVKPGAAVSSALSRGLSLLATFAGAPIWLSNSDMVQRTGLPAPTVARLTRSLTEMGLLHYSASRRRFRLAAGVVRLGYGPRCEAHLVERARPHMQRFADRHGVHVLLAVLDRTDALVLEVCHSAATLVTLRLEAGSRVPLVNTASGHAILSCLSPGEFEAVTNRLQSRHGEDWQEIAGAIFNSLDDIAMLGFARSIGSWHADVNSVAVPLRSPFHSGAMSVVCSAPVGHLPKRRLAEIGEDLLGLAGLLLGERAEDLDVLEMA